MEAAFSGKALSDQHSAVSENQNQHQNQRPFTAKDAQPPQQAKPGLAGDPGNAKEEEGVQQRAETLALKLAQTYEELTRLLERNPGMKRQMTEGTAKQDKVYQKLKQRLKLADMAPRCQWVRQDGTSCGSPQMKQHIYCFAHIQMAEARELMLRLPPPEDANAIQIGIMRIQKSLIEGTISTKIAGLLLYSIQLALTNVGQTTFGKAKDEEMVRETVDEEEAISIQQSAISQNRKPFTAKDAEDAEEIGASGHRNSGTSENQNLPRMGADERGLEIESGPVEWKPSPDMYRMDTREGMEAYEASFRMKIKGTPPRAAVPHEHAEPLPKGPQLHPSPRKSGAVLGTPRFASEPLEASTPGSAF